MNNTVYDIDYTRALPPALKDDETMLSLGKVIAGELQENIRLSRLNIIYARIDELDEPLLDILAHDLHVDWYEYDSEIEVKRAIIKESVKVHKLIGTKYAVERVISAHFGSGIVREWFEYGGEPYHFKIVSENPTLTNERVKQFFQILEVVKRKSAWLDAILITLTGEMSLYTGVCARESTREIRLVGSSDILLYTGTAVHETTKEIYFIGSSDIPLYTGTTLHEISKEIYAIGSSDVLLSFGTTVHEITRDRHLIGSSDVLLRFGAAVYELTKDICFIGSNDVRHFQGTVIHEESKNIYFLGGKQT